MSRALQLAGLFEQILPVWRERLPSRFSPALVDLFVDKNRPKLLAKLQRATARPLHDAGLRPLSKSTGVILLKLTEGLAHPSAPGDGSSRKVDNSTAYLPASIERIGDTRYSVAHYIKQGGDLIADPDIEYVLEDGEWFPVASQLAVGRYDTIFDAQGRISKRTYNDIRELADILIRNIKEQQDIQIGKNAPSMAMQMLNAEARRAGKAAYAAGLPAVPAHDPAIMGLIGRREDRSPAGTLPIYRAWNAGWHAANLAAPKGEFKAPTQEELIGTVLIPRLEEHPSYRVANDTPDRAAARVTFEKALRETLGRVADENPSDFAALRDQFFSDPGYRAALTDRLFDQLYGAPIVLLTHRELEEANTREKFRQAVIAFLERVGRTSLEDIEENVDVAALGVPRMTAREWLYQDPYIRFDNRDYTFYLRPKTPTGSDPPAWADRHPLYIKGTQELVWQCNHCQAYVLDGEDPWQIVHHTFCPNGPVQFRASKLSQIESLLDDLNKKSRRLGVGGDLSLKVVREFTVKMHVGHHDSPEALDRCRAETRPDHWPDIPHVEVELEGRVPKIPGYKLLGVLEHPSAADTAAGHAAGNIIREVPGQTVPARFRTADNSCEHCGLNRARKETVVLEDEAGRVIQVGRSCLADYTGTDDAEARVRAFLAWQETWSRIRDLAEESAVDEYWSEGVDKAPRAVGIEEFLSWVAACVRHEEKFVSSKMVDGDRYHYTSGECGFTSALDARESAKVREKLQPEDREEGRAALDWAEQNLEAQATSNFDHNLVVILKRGYVDRDTQNMAPWIYQKWKRATTSVPETKRVDEFRPEAPSERVSMRLVVEFKTRVDGNYGSQDLYIFSDEAGRAIKLFTTSPDGPSVGDTVELMAEIKQKSIYKGRKQTQIGKVSRGWNIIRRQGEPEPRRDEDELDAPAAPAEDPEAKALTDFVEVVVARLAQDERLPHRLATAPDRDIAVDEAIYLASNALSGTDSRFADLSRRFRDSRVFRKTVRDLVRPHLRVEASAPAALPPPPPPAEPAELGRASHFIKAYMPKLRQDPTLRAAIERLPPDEAVREVVPSFRRIEGALFAQNMLPLAQQLGDWINSLEQDPNLQRAVLTRISVRMTAPPATQPMRRWEKAAR